MSNERFIKKIIKSDSGLINREAIAEEFGIAKSTQEVWHAHNRYGWRDLAIKVGRNVRYRRSDIEQWVESRRVPNLIKA